MQTKTSAFAPGLIIAATVLMTLTGCANQPKQAPAQHVSLQEYVNIQMALQSNPSARAEFAAMEAEKARCEQVISK
jgi:hypothetical protein